MTRLLAGVPTLGFIRKFIMVRNQINVIIVSCPLNKEFIHRRIHSGDYLTNVMNGRENFTRGSHLTNHKTVHTEQNITAVLHLGTVLFFFNAP